MSISTAANAALQLLRETVAEWLEDKAPRLGAALAYYAGFSVAPVLIIAIVIASSVLGSQTDVQERLIGQVATLIGADGAALISRMVDTARLPRDASVLTTVIGVITLLIGALGVFAQLQDALNTIWEVTPRARNGLLFFLQVRLISFAMVLVVGFLLLISLVVNAVMAGVSDYLATRLPYFGLVWAVANLLLPFAVITVLFAVMFKVLPDVDIAWRDVWPGALLTSLLFTSGKYVIGFFLGNSRIGTAYGAAGSLLIVLVWIYFSAQIVFFGAEFTQVYVRHYGKRRPMPTEHAVALSEADRVHQGIPHTATVAAAEAATPLPVRRRAANALRAAVRGAQGKRVSYTSALVAFVAGLGAGVVVGRHTR